MKFMIYKFRKNSIDREKHKKHWQWTEEEEEEEEAIKAMR
jgi:hypothetical protein